MATVRFPIPATNRLASLPVEALTRILAHLLSAAVAHNDQLDTKGTVTRFHSKQPPPLEIGAYLKRFVAGPNAGPSSCLVRGARDPRQKVGRD